MERNSEFTGEFTYEIDSGSDEDFTEDYGAPDKRTSGFQRRYHFRRPTLTISIQGLYDSSLS